jgi:2-oxoglutarate dehydrogenase E2 component (dihydrolipoamide succinyltransferase)
MSFEVRIPSVGESVASAEIGQWHKQEGDTVAIGDLLVTLETDKVSQEITAEAAGILTDLTPEGTEVEIGAIIARITEGAGADAQSSPEGQHNSANAEAVPLPAATEPDRQDAQATPAQPEAEQQQVPATAPKASALPTDAGSAQQKSVAANSGKPESAGNQSPHRITRKRMSPLRRKIADQLVGAQQTAAILTTFNEVDMSAVMRLRKEIQDDFVKRHDIKLGFMSFFVKATVEALKAVPQINARVDGDEVISNHFFDIGVAIGTEKGLIVPVLRDCEHKSFADIEQEIIGYANSAREGTISMEDLRGGVFTISNGGVYGSLLSTPILNPPQSGILGMHTIQQRPVAVDGEVAIRPMMYLALSYDHRIVDGKEAVTFLIRIKECIENPLRLLVEA